MYIKVPLNSNDTDIPADTYYAMLEIKYNSTNRQEINLKEGSYDLNEITIIQDGIRG